MHAATRYYFYRTKQYIYSCPLEKRDAFFLSHPHSLPRERFEKVYHVPPPRSADLPPPKRFGKGRSAARRRVGGWADSKFINNRRKYGE
jgi:hypothetical protein